jgi:hypothetical protein
MIIWVPIPDWEYYEASSCGNIRSIDRVVVYSDGRKRFYPSKILSPWEEKGYFLVELCKGKQDRFFSPVHMLICTTFHGKCPDGLICRHLDDNRKNNHYENLMWGTTQQNVADSIRNGRVFNNHTFDELIANKEKLRLGAIRRWNDPEQRKLQSERIKKSYQTRSNK